MQTRKPLLTVIGSLAAVLTTLGGQAHAQGYQFGTCGAAGAAGPTQAMCNEAYQATSLDGAVIVLNGIQHWTVPVSGMYRVTAIGAQGASAQAGTQGGRGARIAGEFYLLAGTHLRLVVGQVAGRNAVNGSGGGGSFVIDTASGPLLVAGGGAGTRAGAAQDGCDASINIFGTVGSGEFSTSDCEHKVGDEGYGGRVSAAGWGSAGGGYFGAGEDDFPSGNGGHSWATGMRGGSTGAGCAGLPVAHGGFGGGGTGDGCAGGGGGGGYSGGDGGFIAGGGGSFNNGANQERAAGVGVGDGSVLIELADSTPPVIVFTTVPSSLTNSSSSAFAFSTNEPAMLSCSLDGGVAAPCNRTAVEGWATFPGLADGVHTLSVFGVDPASNGSSAQYSWTIDTVAPSLSTLDTLPNPSPINTAIMLSAEWSGATGASYSVDGEAFTDLTLTNGTFAASLGAFTQAGVRDVCVRGMDGAGNVSGSACVLLAIFDPAAGFATGGGWIDSPAGAVAADASLTGKATFGFVSRYQKGAAVPTGKTGFQFQTANLAFHSTAYEWLVISGARAQYKGSGTINGAGDYGFLLTAVDGAVLGEGARDRLRVKIWERATGAMVYDNQQGGDLSDTADPAAVVGGGNIVIHAGKK